MPQFGDVEQKKSVSGQDCTNYCEQILEATTTDYKRMKIMTIVVRLKLNVASNIAEY